MRDEIVGITKYRRTSNSWICTECDSENPETFGSCMVCGRPRTSAARLVGPGLPERNQKYIPSNPGPEFGPYNPPADTPQRSGFNWIPFLIIFIIILIVGLAYASSPNTETPEQLPEYTEDMRETVETADIPGYEVSVS